MRGTVYTLIGTIAWALSGVCCQYLFEYNHAHAAFLTTFRLLVAGCLLLAFSGSAPKFNLFKDRSLLLRFAGFSLAGILLAQYGYLASIKYTDAGTATVLQYTAPVMILAAVCLRRRRLPTAMELLAAALAIAGVFLIATHGDIGALNMSLAGLVWGILAAVGLAVYSLLSARLQLRNSTLVVAGWAMIVSGIVMAVATRPWRNMMIFNAKGILALAIFVIIGTALAFGLYLVGVKMIGAIRASLITSIEPVAAALMAALWMGTTFTVWDIVGFALVIMTVIVLALDTLRDRYRRRGQLPT